MRKCRITEETTSIFKAASDYALALSVSADFSMCSGMALQFRTKFGKVQDLKQQHKHAGSIAVLKDKNRVIYYLVTKEHHHERSTYSSLYCVLVALREQMVSFFKK